MILLYFITLVYIEYKTSEIQSEKCSITSLNKTLEIQVHSNLGKEMHFTGWRVYCMPSQKRCSLCKFLINYQELLKNLFKVKEGNLPWSLIALPNLCCRAAIFVVLPRLSFGIYILGNSLDSETRI